MLVVADQLAVRVSGQGGLAGAGQTEEYSGIAVSADVCGAVHREYALLRQDVVHNGEDRLLDLAGVTGAYDENELLLVVDDDASLGTGAVALRNALEARCRDDGEVLREVLELLCGRTAQQLMDEHILGSQLIDDAEGLGVLRVSACEAVENKDFLALQVSDDLLVQCVEAFLGHRLVDLAPRDLVVYALAVNDELIVCGAAGVLAGLNDQSAGVGQGALAAAKCVLCQLSRSQIAINGVGIDDTELFQSISVHWVFLHCIIF